MEKTNTEMQPWFLHIDLDAFFASVEQLDNPSYRGQPVIVGGRKDDTRGVVSTASYEARKFGVHSAMPIFQAIRLCPNGIFVRGRMERYAELSYQIMNIFKEFSPDVDQMSIDEAFVDLTGTEKLFGPPEETALKVKKRVKEMTGLTVSVGLATTKYLAKIASGYSKPDGFYFIHPGEEQSFMLNLPLKKVWGIGPKALERLKKAGMNTTRDIYDKPLDLLEFIFGTTMGNFLYNVVRGIEKETFTRKHKSHSISAEQTFSCDITDIYTAETELLELAQGVMFRLLKEEKYSRTVTVKIKYDDFTSVSIQKTLDRNIITLDSFFDNIKALFEQKYQRGRGIRLLGVGFDKVMTEDKPFQQSLFGEKEEKKQAVEKAILDLNKKHPEIKIQKARLLKSIALIFIIFSQFGSFCNKNYIFAEDNTVSVKGAGTLLSDNSDINKDEDEAAIFNWDINDKNKVEFNIDGHWEAGIFGSFDSNFGKDVPFTFAPTIPVFKQDVELSSLFTLNKKWYFQGDFADNFTNNTLAVGYNGDGYFRSGRLSNRNITMPDTYSIEQFGYGLSGGQNQAPGISAHWQSPEDKWYADVLVRYDMTVPKNVTFYGMNQVNDSIVKPENFLYGFSYTFPDSAKNHLSNIKNIYVEDYTGTYTDKNGKKYKKLSTGDYYYSQLSNILYLSQNAKGQKNNNKVPTVIVTFMSENSVAEIIKESGDYNLIESYKGKIQNLFNRSGRKYNLNDYEYNFESEIENNKALVIQNSTGFSPFIIYNTYDCGTNSQADISIVSISAGTILDKYVGEIQNNSYTAPYEDFFNLNHVYAKVKNINNEFNQFPFAETNPEIYLNLKSDSDIGVQIRTFSSVTEINIGQKASAGTIQVYKNGILNQDFIYDNKTGGITFSSPIKNTDQIKIVWQEEASNFAKGAFSVGLGFNLKILPELNWDIALTAQKPLILKDTYSTPDNVQSSFAALATGINFTKENFTIGNKTSLAIKKHNDSGKLLVSSQKDNTPKTYELNLFSGFETKAEPEINHKKLYEANNYTEKKHIGLKDDSLKGYKIPLTWSFPSSSLQDDLNTPWAAVDIKLEGGSNLINSSKLKINIQGDNNNLTNIEKIYIQLGINASRDFLGENDNLITFDITDSIKNTQSGWKTIELSLTDKDRAKLTSDNDMRLIVIPKKAQNSSSLNGTLYVGNYTTIFQSIFTTYDENITLFTNSVPSTKDTFSSQITWRFDKNLDLSNPVITATSHFTPSDFNQYEKINIKFAYINESSTEITKKDSSDLIITLDNNNSQINNSDKTALLLKLYNLDRFISSTTDYHTVSVNLKDNSVSLDNSVLDKKDYNLQINNKIVPNRVKYEINTNVNNKKINSGRFLVDNITFEESKILFTAENYINTSYKKDKILQVNNFPIFENGFISADSYQKFTKDNIAVISSLNTGITFAGIALQCDLSMQQKNFVNAGHSIKTASPLLKCFSFGEEYRWAKLDKSQSKNNNFSLSLNNFKIPVSVNSQLSADNSFTQRNQNHKTEIITDFSVSNHNFNFSSSLENNQKINLLKNYNKDLEKVNNDNYFNSWYETTALEFSTGSKYASTRESAFTNKLNFKLFDNKISPSLSYALLSSYENISTPTFSDKTSLDFSVPVTFKNNYISFGLSKAGGDITQTKPEGDYFSDLNKLFSLQGNRTWIYTSIPFYELFDQKMDNKIKGTYSTKYQIDYRKKLFNSFKDLYIPSSVSLSVIRDIKNKDTFSDSYQLKAVVTNNSINNFGSQSQYKLFNWFEQEEIISSITGIMKIPTDEMKNISYQVTAYLQLLFLIKQDCTFHTAFDFSWETGNNWNTSGTLVYGRPGKNCLMSAISHLLFKKTKDTKFDITRKDSLNYKIGTSNKINRQEYSYNHYVDMGFLNYFSVNTSIGATFTYLENSANTLSINYSLGGSMKF